MDRFSLFMQLNGILDSRVCLEDTSDDLDIGDADGLDLVGKYIRVMKSSMVQSKSHNGNRFWMLALSKRRAVYNELIRRYEVEVGKVKPEDSKKYKMFGMYAIPEGIGTETAREFAPRFDKMFGLLLGCSEDDESAEELKKK